MKKTLSFAAIHFSVAFTVGYAIALVEPACNTVAYFFHEKFWQRMGQSELAHAHHA